MKKVIPVFFALFVCFFQTADVRGQTAYTINIEKSRLDYAFKSTLHPVHGTARDFQGRFLIDSKHGLQIMSGEVSVDPVYLQSKNKKRDENMYAMLEVTTYPVITFSLSPEGCVLSEDKDGYTGQLTGTLTIRDISQVIAVPVIVQKSGEEFRMTGTAQVSLKSFRLNAPSVLKVIRVFDPVTITFDVLLNEI